jgi:beta-galactosidase GanA
MEVAPTAIFETNLSFGKVGLNAVQAYVSWNLHKSIPGNVEHFLDLCVKYNLSVIMRPGPYIWAEWAIGGLPYWLETIAGMDTAFHTISPLFMNLADRFRSELLKHLKPKLAGNGTRSFRFKSRTNMRTLGATMLP